MLFLSFLPSSTHWFDLKVFVWLLVEPTCNITKIFENVYLDDISSPFQMSEILLFCFCIWSPPQNIKLFCTWSPPQIQLTFGTCTKSTQPNSADSFHMEVCQHTLSHCKNCQNTHYLVVRIVKTHIISL